MKPNWKKLLLCIAIPLGVGALSALLTMDGMKTFAEIEKPPLTPPGWVFGVVWTILYILMGVASYLVLTSGKEPKAIRDALTLYGIQLGFNFFWSIFFFNYSLYLFSLFWLILLWVLILATLVRFNKISNLAGDLILPYLIWVTFAGYLNYGIYLLN